MRNTRSPLHAERQPHYVRCHGGPRGVSRRTNSRECTRRASESERSSVAFASPFFRLKNGAFRQKQTHFEGSSRAANLTPRSNQSHGKTASHSLPHISVAVSLPPGDSSPQARRARAQREYCSVAENLPPINRDGGLFLSHSRIISKHLNCPRSYSS